MLPKNSPYSSLDYVPRRDEELSGILPVYRPSPVMESATLDPGRNPQLRPARKISQSCFESNSWSRSVISFQGSPLGLTGGGFIDRHGLDLSDEVPLLGPNVGCFSFSLPSSDDLSCVYALFPSLSPGAFVLYVFVLLITSRPSPFEKLLYCQVPLRSFRNTFNDSFHGKEDINLTFNSPIKTKKSQS